MVGHTKVVLILAGGFIVFQDPLLPVQGLGLVLTLCGVFMYTHFKVRAIPSRRGLSWQFYAGNDLVLHCSLLDEIMCSTTESNNAIFFSILSSRRQNESVPFEYPTPSTHARALSKVESLCRRRNICKTSCSLSDCWP